jgi:Sulfotransferase family
MRLTQELERDAPPVFVVGAGRSGTTLVRVILDAGPELAIPFESHFIPGLWRTRARFEDNGRIDAVRLMAEIASTRWFQAWELSTDAVIARVRQLPSPGFADVIGSVFLAYADTRGKQRWGDKTPGYVVEIPTLSTIFPNARFVHVVRDGRDVALSLREMDWGHRRGPHAVPHMAEYWRQRVRRGRAAGVVLGSARYMEVRYESLVEHPETILNELCRFLAITPDPSMLRFFEHATAAVPEDRGGFHRNLSRPITRGLRDWRVDMSPADVAAFEAVAGDDLDEMGYPREFASIPWRVRIDAASRVRSARAMKIAKNRSAGALRMVTAHGGTR